MSTVSKIIDSILDSKKKLYLAITGGGLGAISKLTENGGASSVLLGATIPYSPEDLNEIVGSYVGAKAVSKECAKALSNAGYRASSSINIEDNNGVCVSCTASLRKKGKEREGREHKAFIGVNEYDFDNRRCVRVYEINFLKDRSRVEEEYILSCLVLAVADKHLSGRKTAFSAELIKELTLIDGEVNEE